MPAQSLQHVLSEAIRLADEIPALLIAFAKIPLASMVSDRLEQYKAQAQQFDFSGMIKEILPVPTYKRLRQEAFEALKPENFQKLSRDEQAAALALMESYNAVIKSACLALDKIEIENGIIAGSLSTKVGLVDGKSLKALCDELNEVYKAAMVTGGFTNQAELYPYSYSIQQQRKEMLAALTAGSGSGDRKTEDTSEAETIQKRKKIVKERVEDRLSAAGEIPEPPKRENPEEFYKFMKKMLDENYKRLVELKNQLTSDLGEVSLEEGVDQKAAPVDLTKKAKEMISKVEEELKNVLDEEVYKKYFETETIADET